MKTRLAKSVLKPGALLVAGILLADGRSTLAAQQVSSRQDPVEQASATLSQTLAAHYAEQAQLMQMQAQAFALWKEGVFSQPSQGTTIQTVSPLTASPTVIQDVLGQGSLDWLAGQGNPLVTGFQPIAGRQGLLVSYTIPTTDSLAFLRGRSWTYDNAVGAIAFLLQGRPGDARTVLTALQGLMAPDGSLGFSYQVDSSFVDGHIRTGTLAWVGYAMVLYQRQTGDASFQASAEKIGAYLKGLQLASGSLRGGPDVSWASTEHNVDAYFFYRELYRVTGKSTTLATANQIKSSLLTHHWIKTSNSTGYFAQGLGDPTKMLDPNSWGGMFAAAVGETQKANQALQFVESAFKNTQKVTGTNVRVTGYSPDTAKKTVWVEGTVGVAAAYQRLGQTAKAGSVLDQINTLQNAWQSAGKWHGALPYATPRYKNSDGDTYSDLESVASTGWLQIALDLQDGSSLFWDKD